MTAALEIIIEKSLVIDVSVQEFVTLNEKSVFLVLADADLASGSIFTWDGEAMYYSETYGAWAYLIISDRELDLEQVRSHIKVSVQKDRILPRNVGDVDKNGNGCWKLSRRSKRIRCLSAMAV